MTRRTVLQNTGMSSTKYGAFERYLLHVAAKCRERGYGTVMQYDHLPTSDVYIRDLEQVGVRLEIVPSHGSAVRVAAGCSRLVLKHRPSVVNNHFVGRIWDVTVPAVSRLIGVRTLVKTVHGDPRYRNRSRIRFVYDRFDRVLAVSDAVRSSLVEGGVTPDRVETLRLGLIGDYARDDAERLRLRELFSIPPSAVVVACIAFAASVKGVDILLQAVKSVLESHPDIYLLLVGVGPSDTGLVALASELDIANRVVWAGVVDDAWRLLAAADVYVQPSRSEGLPFSVMEAMAMGIPVVATNVGGVREAVVDGETGVLADADPISLSTALKDLLDQPSRWGEYGKRGATRYLTHFAGEASVDRLLGDIYRLPTLG